MRQIFFVGNGLYMMLEPCAVYVNEKKYKKNYLKGKRIGFDDSL